MELQEFLDYMNSGKTVIAHSDIHRYMSELALEALRLTAELNGSYHTPEEIISIFEQLTGKPVDSSLKIFPPFCTDCGKNLTVGKNVFFNSGCKVQDQGGITIGDGTLIGHNVVLATLNHEFEPSRRADMRPRPIKIGCNVWIGSNATILPGVPLFFNRFGGVPQGIPVCVLRRGMGRQHDFGVDDFAFMGIVFLFLVVFGKQPFPALVGGRRNG